MDFGIQNNKGITLIALVVTIVILIILGGISISMLTGQNGILKKSQQAKEKTEISNELENVKLTTFSALTQNGTLIEKEEFQNILSQQKIDLEFIEENNKSIIYKGLQYYIINKLSGNIDTLQIYWKNNGDGTLVSSDGAKVEIGDYINYDALLENKTENVNATSEKEKNGSKDQNYSIISCKWQILNAEDGKLQIISEDTVGSLSLYGRKGAINGVDELNNICKIYGNGKYALSARSVNVDDINSLTKYDPDKEKWRNNGIEGYGKKTTYKYLIDENGEHKLYYKSDNDDYKESEFNNFGYIKNNIWNDLTYGNEITIYNTAYRYDIEKYISKDSKIYNMIFNNSDSNIGYWLASSYSFGRPNGPGPEYDLFRVKGKVVDCYIYYGYVDGLCWARGTQSTLTYDIRPIVTLNKDITLKLNKEENNYNTFDIDI